MIATYHEGQQVVITVTSFVESFKDPIEQWRRKLRYLLVDGNKNLVVIVENTRVGKDIVIQEVSTEFET